MADLIAKRDGRTFRGVKYHLNQLLELRPDYEFVMIAAQGSQNYGLDMYTKEYTSDVDTIAIVLPPLNNFINNDKYISETIVLDNNEHIDVKDVRLIFELFAKQNIKYLEILFTKYRIINPRYKDIVLELLNKADNITKSNPQKLVTCAFGMQLEKCKALEHPYEGLKDKIEKYGYDGKQLHHIIRLHEFALMYIGSDCGFKEALNAENYDISIRKDLEKAKLSQFTLEEAREYADKYSKSLSNIRDLFCKKDIPNNEDDITQMLNDIKSKLFTSYLKNMFVPKEKKEKGLMLPSLDKIWVTSDLHFGHENMLGFEPKRFEMLGTTETKAIANAMIDDGLTNEEVYNIPDDLWEEYKKKAHHNYIEKHDEELIKRWNENVKKNDVVFILGDLSFRNGKETNEIIKRLNGRKILIKGNHDNICMDKDFDTSLFEAITDYMEIRVEKHHFILSHYPFRVWNQQHKNSIQLFGHIHSNDTTSHPMKEDIPLSWNVGVDVNDYKPVSLKVYAITADYYTKLNEVKQLHKEDLD